MCFDVEIGESFSRGKLDGLAEWTVLNLRSMTEHFTIISNYKREGVMH